MVKSYFLLYKRAKKLYDEGKVTLTNVKSDDKQTTYFFQCNGHQVSLTVSNIPGTRLWLRHWGCDCEHFSLWQDKTECKHIKSSELYLMNGGYHE